MNDFYWATKIEEASHIADLLLKNAFIEARNRHTVSRRDKSHLQPLYKGWLSLANRAARVTWGRAVSRHFSEYFCPVDGLNHNQEMYFFTLADNSCAYRTSDRPDFADIKSKLRAGLRGLSYVGFIEPAFYVNLQAGTNFAGEKRCIFWHLNAFVWGETEKTIRLLVRKLNRSGGYLPIAPGYPGVRSRKITQGELSKTVGYTLKPPTVGYRVSKIDARSRDGSWKTNSDGEVLRTFKHGKSELRKGERITLFHATKNTYLDELSVAGGEGRTLLAKIKRTALAVDDRNKDHRKRRRRINC